MLAGGAPAEPPDQDDVRDFGPTEIGVQAVRSLEVGPWNELIAAAAGRGEIWTRDPIQAALTVTGQDFQSRRTTIECDAPGEGRSRATVVLVERGWLDDAVDGQRFKIWLGWQADGTWRVDRALWAARCRRTHIVYYTADPCP